MLYFYSRAAPLLKENYQSSGPVGEAEWGNISYSCWFWCLAIIKPPETSLEPCFMQITLCSLWPIIVFFPFVQVPLKVGCDLLFDRDTPGGNKGNYSSNKKGVEKNKKGFTFMISLWIQRSYRVDMQELKVKNSAEMEKGETNLMGIHQHPHFTHIFSCDLPKKCCLIGAFTSPADREERWKPLKAPQEKNLEHITQFRPDMGGGRGEEANRVLEFILCSCSELFHPANYNWLSFLRPAQHIFEGTVAEVCFSRELYHGEFIWEWKGGVNKLGNLEQSRPKD